MRFSHRLRRRLEGSDQCLCDLAALKRRTGHRRGYAHLVSSPSFVKAEQRRKPWATIAPIVVAALVGLALIWLVAVPLGPEVCALSLPGPRNCFVSQRLDAAPLPTIVIVLLAAASIAICLIWSRRARVLRWVATITLVAATVGAYLLVAWIPALAWINQSGADLLP